jgi:hypothetical protein
MPIFQKSVIQKHLANLEQNQLDDAFKIFKHNYSVDKIQQIKTLKEEEYQDGFLRDIFEHSLNELEEFTANDKKKTKRKKDEKYYPSKYITQYIVENTLGTLLKNAKSLN